MPRKLNSIHTGLLLLLSFFVLSACGEKTQKMDAPSEEFAFRKEGDLRILQAETDSVLMRLDIEIADTEYETQTGLMYRKDMESEQAMLFVFESSGLHSFYMKNTLIPLDLLFVDEDLRIVTIHENARPLDESGIPSRVPVKYVLEIKAGMSDLWGVAQGDRIQYEKTP